MASEDALLLRSMRSTSGKAAVPFDVPEVEPEVVVEPEDDESLGDLRDRYQELSSTVSRPEYRGFEIPADMGRDRVGDWLAAIDVREDAREAREAEPYLTRTPDPWEGQFLEQMKGLSLEASLEEQRFLRDPAGRAEVYKDWAGDVYEDVMAGDPETIRNVADVSSLVDITGGSDLTSAVQSGRLAAREPERRVSHLTDTAISGLAGTVQGIATVFGAAPLVGTWLSGARLKAAMRGADVAEDVAAAAKGTTVVDDAGEPLRVYHGTPRQFDEFDTARMEGRAPGSKPEQTEGQGTYFSESRDSAAGFAGSEGRVVEAFLDIKNPFVVGESSFGEAGKSIIRKQLETQSSSKRYIDEKMEVLEKTTDLSGIVPPNVITAAMRADGFDGVKSLGPQKVEHVVFDASQIIPAQKAAPDAPAPVFESVLEKAVAESMPAKIGVDDVEQFLNKKGAKKSEIADTKVPDFVAAAKASGKKSVTKDELIKHLEDNKVQIEEVRLSDNVPIPQEVRDLGVKKLEASRALRSEVESLSGVLAPGKNLGTMRHKFEQDPTHFNGLYLSYVGGIKSIPEFRDIPTDVRYVANYLMSLAGRTAHWTPDEAALITEARKTINAKLADPAYKKFVDQHSLSRVDSSSPGADPDFLKQARGIRRQHQKLQKIAEILNKMPEAESRLAALRKFENLPKYQEYSSLHRQHKTKLTAVAQVDRTRWEEYTVPGGEDYQEILLTVPTKRYTELPEGFEVLDVADVFKNLNVRGHYQVFRTADIAAGQPAGVGGRHLLGTPEDAKQFALDEMNEADDWVDLPRRQKFTESHFSGIPNVLAHIRFKVRIDSRGRRIMFIEEIQSDWHQMGLKRGYQGTPLKLPDDLELAVQRLKDAQDNLPAIKDRYYKLLGEDDFSFKEMDALEVKIKAADSELGAAQKNFTEAIKRNDPDNKFSKHFSELPSVYAQSALEPNLFRQSWGHMGGGPQVPDAPLKDTKEWTALAIKRIFREAAEQGYDGVAFSRADMITPLVTMRKIDALDIIRSGNPADELQAMLNVMDRSDSDPIQKVYDGSKYFYDKLIPSIAKKETKAKQGTTYIELEDVGFSSIRDPEYPTNTAEFFDTPAGSASIERLRDSGKIIEVPFFELTDKVRDKVIKPQKLYSLALPGIAIGAAAAGEEELSAAAALGAIGMGGMALYKGAKAARAAKLEGLTDLKGNAPKLNDDGTITLYHRTTPEAAAEIRRTGKFVSKENTDEVFLSSKRTGQAEGHGSEVVEVRVDPDKVRLDDAFDDEIHVAVKTADVPKPPAAAEGAFGARHAGETTQHTFTAPAKLPEAPDEIEAAFSEMNRIQRGAPESAMDGFRFHNRGEGPAGFLTEHIGDLTARLGHRAYGPVAEKVGKTYDELPGGFVRTKNPTAPLKDVLTDHSYRKQLVDEGYRRYSMMMEGEPGFLARDEWVKQFDQKLANYADEHRKVPVYNEVQRLANDAAVALGEQRYIDSRDAMAKLQKYIDEGEERFTARMSWVEPEFARFPGGAIPPGKAVKTELPDFSAEYKQAKEHQDLVSGLMASRKAAEKSDALKAAAKSLEAKPPAAADVATAGAKTDTPEFKTWFGKSKVVDEAGEPLVVYHGTTGDFDVFKNPYAEDVAGGGWHMFADNADYSSQFTFTHGKGSIVPVYLSVKNPLDLTALPARRGDVRVKLIRALRRAGIDPDALDIPYEDDLYKFINRRGFRADLKNAAQEAGYDGIIFKDVHGTIDSTTHVVFDSTQIKSKFNKGTFDPTDPSILKGIGIGAAVPAAAAVRSQRGEEQGNPLPDEPVEEAPYEPYYTGEDYVQSYELSDSREVYQQRTGLKSRFNKLASELALVEAEYYSLPDEERASKRGDVLHEWHNERLDDLSVVGAELDSGEYLRFLRGEDYYYETRPYSLDDFDANRAFDVIDYNGPKIPDDIEMRAAQELGQAGLFESIIDMGGPMVHLSGPNGAMNRFVYNKAQSFNHPVQSVQLNRSDKLALMKDINNVQSLKDAGLISFLLYKELIGDVQLF